MAANWEDGIADEVLEQLLAGRGRATVFAPCRRSAGGTVAALD